MPQRCVIAAKKNHKLNHSNSIPRASFKQIRGKQNTQLIQGTVKAKIRKKAKRKLEEKKAESIDCEKEAVNWLNI